MVAAKRWAVVGELWKEFLPLSMSDVMMAVGDPLTTMTLARLPEVRINLAAVGIAKTWAIFFESPIIMVLHASNALSGSQASRRSLLRFAVLAGVLLSGLLGLVALPGVFDRVGPQFLGAAIALGPRVQMVLGIMVLWPLAISWRRYFQGLLIAAGQSGAVAQAAIVRIVSVMVVLGIGWWCRGWGLPQGGAIVASASFMAGVVMEAIAATWLAVSLGATKMPELVVSPELPQDLRGVWRFYWPLANSMLVDWGGRAMLVGVVARSHDAAIALAAWPAAWGLVAVILNATRMVQQMVIKHRGRVGDRDLALFVLSVGVVWALLLVGMGGTPVGGMVVRGFVGGDLGLVERIRPVLLLCGGLPILVAVQNGMQGALVGMGRTGGVNQATWLGTGVLLCVGAIAVGLGVDGAVAGGLAMGAGMVVEVGFLGVKLGR